MSITFPDGHATNAETFGINFPIDNDGERIICLVTTDALQDVNPSNAMDNTENQFNDNIGRFQSIAEEKILNGEIVDGRIVIEGRDVRPNIV